MNIEVTRDNVTILEQSERPHENEYKITTCYFTFDEFTGLFQVKRAIFTILSTGEMYETDIINNQCDIPSEVLQHAYETVKLGVYGYNIGENDELLNRFSPSYAEFVVPTGSYEEDAQSPEPITPSQYDLYSQALQEGLQEVDDKLDEVVETVDGKIVEIEEAIENAERLDVDANKVGKITSITITKQDGTTQTVTLEDGMGLEYNWLDTSLGIKREDEQEYQYVNLKGDKGDAGAIKMIIVQELPEIGQEDTIYLVPLETPESQENKYAEYVYIDNAWELLGKIGIEVDLTDYYTKTETNNLLDTKVGFTDYATNSTGGVIKTHSTYGTSVDSYGRLRGTTNTYEQYQSANTLMLISKATLDNVITGKALETANNKVTSISSNSTDTQYPSAKCVYDLIGNLETILTTLDIGGGAS